MLTSTHFDNLPDCFCSRLLTASADDQIGRTSSVSTELLREHNKDTLQGNLRHLNEQQAHSMKHIDNHPEPTTNSQNITNEQTNWPPLSF